MWWKINKRMILFILKQDNLISKNKLIVIDNPAILKQFILN